MIRQKVKRQGYAYDEDGNLVPSEYVTMDITVESVGDIIDLLSDCSRGATVFMIPPEKGDSIQRVQVFDCCEVEQKLGEEVTLHGVRFHKAFAFTIGGHGPFEMVDCYKKQLERETAEGGRRTAGLSWKDIERVVTAENDIIEKYDRAKIDRMPEKEYYTKILERYNELKHG